MAEDFSAAKLRELVDGSLAGRDRHVLSHAGTAPDELLSRSLTLADEVHTDLESTRLYDAVVSAERTERVREALQDRDAGLANWLVGVTDQDVDLSAAHGLLQVLERVRRPGYVATFFGLPDVGKTNVAVLMAELALIDDPEMVLVTNVTSLKSSVPDDRLRIVEDMPTLEDTTQTLTDFGRPAVTVLDEFSSHASGYSADRQQAEDQLRPWLRATAKLDTRVIAIGHDGQDVHPTARELSTDVIWMHKTETVGLEADPEPTYRAEVYDGVEDREPTGHRFTVDPVPETGLTYNPDEQTDWRWS